MSLAARWNELYHYANGRATVGMAGVRDPEDPCAEFRPGVPAGECSTDGHYLCRECAEQGERCKRCGLMPQRGCECPEEGE